MLIAEELLLLCYDDESGKASFDHAKVDYALAGAVLVELSLQGKVGVAEPGESVKAGRLVVRDPSGAGDPLLDEALADLSDDEGKKPKNVLGSLRKGLRDRLLNRLAQRGLLRRERGKILGLFPTTRWPAADAAYEAQLRESLRSVLVDGATPDARTAALVSLLSAVDVAPKVVPSSDRRVVKRRAKEIAEGAWAADAVRMAVEEISAAVGTAVIVAAAGATGGN
jgi:hypothetical protein